MRGVKIWLTIAAVVLAGMTAGIAQALDNGGVPWQKSADPALSKVVDLPANIMPEATNFDCTNITVRVYRGSAAEPDCVTTVPFGQVGTKGVVFTGSTEYIPVVPKWPLYNLQPIPNSATFMTYANAPIIGNYLVFYKSIYDKLESEPKEVYGRWQYNLIGKPDYYLVDTTGKLLAANIDAMAFSSNGQWMVVDLPWQGFVRINLSTFEIRPFAPSMQETNEYSSHIAHIAVSDDGQTVAVQPNGYSTFKIYNLTDCGDNSLPVQPGQDRCKARDYYSYVHGQLPGFHGLYQLRFMNNVQLSFSAVYDYTPGKYKVAKYTLTAPGENAVGLSYLGMGDSFASGEGAYEYLDGTDTANNTCHLSSRNYAYLLTSHLYAGGKSVSCSGAVTDDIVDASVSYEGQVKDHIRKDKRSDINTILTNYTPGYIAQTEFIDQYRPEVITLSIGGNDIGFADILQSCVSPAALPETCYPNYEDRLELANQINGIFDRLVTTYKTVAKPGKRVYVVGYPQIALPGGDCAVNVSLDNHEIQMAEDLISYLNLVIEQAANKAGVRYVDVSDAFAGHRLCEAKSSDVAVNGFTAGKDSGVGIAKFIGNESYHPNALGHNLLEWDIRIKTNNLQLAMPAPNPSAQPPATSLALYDDSLPKSGRQVNQVVAGKNIAPQLIERDKDINIYLDGTIAALKALTAYKMVIHSDPIEVGTATTDAQGVLDATVHIPASVPPGFHTLHIYGPNILGQPIDVTKTVYVAPPMVRTTNSVTLTNNTITFTR